MLTAGDGGGYGLPEGAGRNAAAVAGVYAHGRAGGEWQENGPRRALRAFWGAFHG